MTRVQYKPQFIFFMGKDWVIYSSIINGDRFMSAHKRTGLTNEQCKGYFEEAHDKEVRHLLKEKLQHELRN